MRRHRAVLEGGEKNLDLLRQGLLEPAGHSRGGQQHGRRSDGGAGGADELGDVAGEVQKGQARVVALDRPARAS